MSPKTGRPKADNPKDIRYSVRLDVKTEEKLQEYCKKHNITKGEAIRQGIHLLLAEKKQSVAHLPKYATLYKPQPKRIAKSIIAYPLWEIKIYG